VLHNITSLADGPADVAVDEMTDGERRFQQHQERLKHQRANFSKKLDYTSIGFNTFKSAPKAVDKNGVPIFNIKGVYLSNYLSL
jgi:hypothetical protein